MDVQALGHTSYVFHTLLCAGAIGAAGCLDEWRGHHNGNVGWFPLLHLCAHLFHGSSIKAAGVLACKLAWALPICWNFQRLEKAGGNTYIPSCVEAHTFTVLCLHQEATEG